MKLGFVSAILPDLSLEQLLDFAKQEDYDCIEVLCWPKGKASRRYAGVTHIDVENFGKKEAEEVTAMTKKKGVSISALGYYPNPLTPNTKEATVAIEHIKKVIKASALLGINQMNTFVGRDWKKSVEDNWPQFKKIWKPIIKLAEKQGVRVGIENCPMSFTADEWPGGKNLATTPAIWEKMFRDIQSDYFGLNYDPSHFIWQHMDALRPIRDWGHKIFHVHAKDVRLDLDRLDQVGIMAHPNEYHTPKLPGMGDVDWGKFFSYLGEQKYNGPVCVEVEDRVFEGSLAKRKASLRQSATYLRQFMPKM